jgi:hypothetical protein
MIQRLLLTSFFIDNKTKPNTIIGSFPCWNSCVWVLHCCITSQIMSLHQWHNLVLEYFIKRALDVCKVRSKLLGLRFKGMQNIFSCHQLLHCLILTFRSKYETYCHSFSTGTVDLHIDSARIFGSCTSCLVIPVVPVDLHIPSVRSSECKHVMSCIHVE